MPRHGAGASGKNFVRGSESASFPSSTRSITAVEVNCFPTEPDWKIVSGRTATWCSTLARP